MEQINNEQSAALAVRTSSLTTQPAFHYFTDEPLNQEKGYYTGMHASSCSTKGHFTTFVYLVFMAGIFIFSSPALAQDLGENLAVSGPGAGSDGSSKASGTSYKDVRDGDGSTYWQPSSSSNERISIKWSGDVAFNTVILKETGSNVSSWELVNNNDGSLLASGSSIGSSLQVDLGDVSMQKINLMILSASSAPQIAEFEVYNASGGGGSGGSGSSITLQENQAGFCQVDGFIESEHSGYTGDGYANVDPNESGKEIVWSVDAPSAGSYTLQWRFANGGGSDRSCELVVNGSTVATGISFPSTGAWNSWDLTAEVTASLAAGMNTITLIGEVSSGQANIDYLEVSGDSPSVGDCSPGGGTTEYSLTSNVNGSGSVSLDPAGGTYEDGTEVTLTATPDTGWEFSGWSGDLSGSTNPATLIMDTDKTVTVNFTEVIAVSTITLQENQAGFCSVEGLVESEHSGYTGDGYVNVDPNESGKEIVWSVDAPSAGSYTLQWRFANGGGSDRPCELVVNGSTVATGISFPSTGAWNSWDLTAEVTANLMGGMNTITLVGESSDGQANIDYLEVTGDSPSSGNCSGSAVNYALTTNTSGSGSVSLDPAGGAYEDGTEVTLTASPDSDWEFSGWSGDLSGSTNPATLVMDADKAVTATFVESTVQYNLSTSTTGSGSIILDPAGGTYNEGTTITVTANPSSGWEFNGWSGDLSGSVNPETIIMDADKSLIANFVESGGGTVTGPGSFVLEALTSATFEEGAHYMVINRSNGKAMDVENRSIENDASIIVADPEDVVHQLWRTEDQGSNYYVVNGYTDKVAREASGNVRQERDGSSSTHRWSIEHLQDTYFRLINSASGNAISISGDNVVTVSYDGSASQQWEIFKVTAETETPDFNVEGFATVGFGITGGAGGETVTVDNAGDLIFYMQHADPYIIQVSGTISLPEGDAHSPSDHMHNVAPNKTIIGLGADAHIQNGGFNIRGTRNDGVGNVTHTNVIIRNLTFSQAPDDCINIEEGARNVWVDHNEFFSSADGMVDVKREASHVTVSWNIMNDQGKTMLLGHDASHTFDEGHLKVSYHHNYFNSTDSRHPRIRYGEAHLYNNYFTNIGSYVVGPGIESSTISENNHVWVSNRFTDWYHSTGVVMDRGMGSLLGHIAHDHDLDLNSVEPDWSPENYYSYTLHSALNVKQMVLDYAGVGIVDGNGDISIQYSLGTQVDGEGSIALDPDGGSYDDGETVTLTATPASGWIFDGWSGDLTGTTNPETILMDANKSVTAIFSSTLPPGNASNPSPTDGASGVNVHTNLEWTAGSGSESHDVYFGTSSSPQFQQSQASTIWSPPSALDPLTTYYWRIDEVNSNGTTTGTVWNFTTDDGSVSASNDLVGFAALDGSTTGGEGGTSVTCATGDCILDAISDKRDGTIGVPLIIYVDGTVSPSNTSASKIDIKDVSDISILGIGTSGVFDQVGLKIWRASNIIIRNVTIHHVSDGDGDCIGIEGPSDHIWVDHCELYNEFQGVGKDFYDGLLDLKRDVDYVTLSWNYLHDSWKTSLSGSSDSDSDHRRVTYHHNWFENNNSRLPLFRFGEGHLFNNYYNGIESTGINSRMGACIRVENNYFENAHNPIVSCYSSQLGATDESGNIFGSNVTWDLSGSDCNEPLDCSWNAPYLYNEVLNSANDVPSVVMQNAGVGVISISGSRMANLSDVQEKKDVTVYPNPAVNWTTIRTHNSEEIQHIRVVNLSGTELMNIKPTSRRVNLDISELSEGLYFVHIVTSSGTVMKKLLKQ